LSRIGVFVCECGGNISDTVDVDKVVEAISKHPEVTHAEKYVYMCSDPGQKMLQDAIKEHKLDAVVVAACSPNLHEITFQDASEEAGLNKYRVEMANIREHCSWVHDDMDSATKKAVKVVKSIVEKVSKDTELVPITVGVNRKALVIGGGIAGMQAALDIADSGYKVILVEKSPTIGGHMAQLSKTFPTLDCAQCILAPKMSRVARHKNIKTYTYSEVIDVSGHVGNFHVKIKKKPTYVDESKCNLCDKCTDVCPVFVESEFDIGLDLRRAIYIPFAQAVPSTYTIDIDHCLGMDPLRCGKCIEVCEPDAINPNMEPEIIDEDVGCVILATGFDIYGKEKMPEYGKDKYEDVITALEFERLLNPTGPTSGKIERPSDGKIAKKIVFIQCAGSRDPDNHKPYCSKICCMYTAKQALLYKQKIPDSEVYIFYIDIRAGGKDYEEFIDRAMTEEGIIYLRGKVSKVYQEGDKLRVYGVDTLLGKNIEVDADLVVLASAMLPSKGTEEVARFLGCSLDKDGFLKEAHPKLRPVESLNSGIFLAGAAQAPKDIPETITQASASASKALGIISSDKLSHPPTIATIDDSLCSGCRICVSVCPYNAIEIDKARNVVRVNDVLCEGCGVCAAACPAGAIQIKNSTDEQIINMVKAILEEV